MRPLQRRQQGTFVWGFNDVTGLALPECGTFSLFVGPSPVSGQQPPAPPYTLIAYPVQGVPFAYPLTLTGSTAPWTVDYPAGTRLMLNIADANGNSGGVPPEIYTVQSGQSKACLRSASTPAVTMRIDEPSALLTCSVFPIHIEGGQKPYSVTLAVADSSAPSNRTMGSDHDTYEWVNQSAPNSSFVIAVSDSKGQYAVTSKLFTTSGSTDASCPGQISRSYNSNNPNGGTNNTTSSTSSNSSNNSNNNNNGGSGDGNNNKKDQIPIYAWIGAAVGALVLLSLVLFICFRRRKNKNRRKPGVGVRERKRYHNPKSDYSPDGSQAKFAHNNVGVPVQEGHSQLTPFVLPDPRSSAALSYYGDHPTTPNQNAFSQYPPPSSVLPPVKYQQRPENQQWSQSAGWQPGFAYPPPSPSPIAPENYQSSIYQGIVTSTEPRMPHNVGVGPSATPLSPQQTLTSLRTSGYSDSGSRRSTYTTQNLVPPKGSEGSPSGSGAGQNAPETRPDKGDPLLGQPLQQPGGTPRVYQHEDAGVVELPPAYQPAYPT